MTHHKEHKRETKGTKNQDHELHEDRAYGVSDSCVQRIRVIRLIRVIRGSLFLLCDLRASFVTFVVKKEAMSEWRI
jgi:hypothetical protein